MRYLACLAALLFMASLMTGCAREPREFDKRDPKTQRDDALETWDKANDSGFTQ